MVYKNIECCTKILDGKIMLSATMQLYILIFENYIPTNLYSFHTLHINSTVKQKKVHLPMAPFSCAIWLNRSY